MKHNPNTDDMATNSRKQNTTSNSNSQLMKTLMEGLGENQWGYGFRRISVTVNPDVGFHHQIPYTFTSLGYKDEQGKWFVGLRMNVDQVSPLKLRPMNMNTELKTAWADMMSEFVREYVMNNKQ